ncbi:bacterioferritin [uncultured Pseudoteredinibacter sp.]|uniref:bacterioferritin n=1 Tax=uncultured Pseudoteredinibacter sp. TaxID=1641701 RepID=UPI002620A10F|nr:bacterioferritin [uncultured Pseudoteredinibacter sp.]
MQGDNKVIEWLNKLLEYELTAVDQYFIHSRMYEDWGLTKLYERIGHERDDELGHADLLIRRILFLGGVPNMAKRSPMNIGQDVPAMLQSDLDLEIHVGNELKDAMAHCESVKDYVTRDTLLQMLDDTEVDHEYWLRQQLGLIDRMGVQNYLQSVA